MRSMNYSIGVGGGNVDMSGNNYQMFADDATLYADIPLYNHPEKTDPYKQPLEPPSDPWLVAQAGDAPFNSSDNIFGSMSPELEQFANSVLSNEVSLPVVDDALSMDLALNYTPQNDSELGLTMESLVLDSTEQQQQQQLAATPSRRRSKRLSSKAASGRPYSEDHISGDLYHSTHEFGITEDTTGAETESSEEATTQRRRRPRVSYTSLTEEERYQRIRELNNEASRHYRGRRREQETNLQQREAAEMQRNKVLKAKEAGLERLRDEIKEYTYNFFREHVNKH